MNSRIAQNVPQNPAASQGAQMPVTWQNKLKRAKTKSNDSHGGAFQFAELPFDKKVKRAKSRISGIAKLK